MVDGRRDQRPMDHHTDGRPHPCAKLLETPKSVCVCVYARIQNKHVKDNCVPGSAYYSFEHPLLWPGLCASEGRQTIITTYTISLYSQQRRHHDHQRGQRLHLQQRPASSSRLEQKNVNGSICSNISHLSRDLSKTLQGPGL